MNNYVLAILLGAFDLIFKLQFSHNQIEFALMGVS